MADLTPRSVWKRDKDDLLALINSGIFIRESKKIHFYVPSLANYKTRYFRSSLNHFPTFSVTGSACALNCRHCGSRVLASMIATDSPPKLFEAVKNLKSKGGVGCLVSGGCSGDGSVPFESFISTLARIKQELNLTIMVHTGILDFDTARKLKQAGIDVALIDIIGSNKTIRKTCKLPIKVQNYEESLRAISEACLDFVPHIVVGLENGKLEGEFSALEMISRYKPPAIVIIAFMPIPGTDMADVPPPESSDIAKVIATARLMFPQTQLALGCMRPKGKNRQETDVLALKAGINGIAFPSEKVIEFAEQQGYESSFSNCCCAQIYQQNLH